MTNQDTAPKHELGPADLLVEGGQSWVEGWTIQRVRDYSDARVAAAKKVRRLTDEEIETLWCEYPSGEEGFARAIEAEFMRVNGLTADKDDPRR